MIVADKQALQFTTIDEAVALREGHGHLTPRQHRRRLGAGRVPAGLRGRATMEALAAASILRGSPT